MQLRPALPLSLVSAFPVLSIVCAMAWSQGALAQAGAAFPARPVTLVVPFPPGGPSDALARAVAQKMGEHLGQPLVIENLGGASGGIAAQKVLNSPPDGHVIFQGSPNELILAPLAISSIKFKSEDFRLVQMIATAQIAFLAKKDLPVNTVDEFVDHARKAAKDGKPLTFASVGPGSFYHLLGEHLSKVTTIPMTHVAYKGGAPAVQDLIGGQVDIFMTPYGKGQVQLVEDGKLKALAVTSPTRMAALPDVPTFGELGFPQAVFASWFGLAAPPNTPVAILERFSAEVRKVMQASDVRQKLEAAGFRVTGTSREEFAKIVRDEYTHWGKAVRSTGFKAD